MLDRKAPDVLFLQHIVILWDMMYYVVQAVLLSITDLSVYEGRKSLSWLSLTSQTNKGGDVMVTAFQIVYYSLGILAYCATLYALYQKEKNARNGHS